MTKEELYEEISKQGTPMIPKKRMSDYMAGKEVDCIPHKLLSVNEALAFAWGFSKKQMNSDPGIYAGFLEKKQEVYKSASISLDLGLRGMGIALGSEEVFCEKSVNYIGKWALNDYGRLDILENFEVGSNDFLINKMEFARELKKRLPDMAMSAGIAGPLSTAVAVRPIEKLLRDMRSDPYGLKRLLELVVSCNLKYVKTVYEKFGITSWSIADPVTTTDIVGMKYFRTFSRPYIEELFHGIKEITGSIPSLHICGHSSKLWQDLADIGFNMLSVDNCESMAEFRKTVGERMLLSGNVPPVDVLLRGTIDDVIDSVKESIKKGAENPSGFILCSGCQVPVGTPIENIDAFCFAARRYGAGAVKGKMPKGAVA